MTKSGVVEKLNFLLDSGSDHSFILNSVLDKLEMNLISWEISLTGRLLVVMLHKADCVTCTKWYIWMQVRV